MPPVESSSKNLYDLIWGVRRDTPDWSVGRFEKLYDLIGTYNIRGKRVLDVCCGMGSKTYAALELGAKVWAHDGSVEGPNLLKKHVEDRSAMPETLKGWRRWLYRVSAPDARNLTLAAGIDITGIVNHFGNQKFDVVYMGWALMHVEDPARAAADLQKLTAPGGLIAVSYFNQNSTSQIIKDIREYTLGLPMDEAAEITAKIGKRWGFDKSASLRDLLEDTEGNRTLAALKRLAEEKGYTPE
ncbi:MAG: class I SAM-dependent methyltransferase, partial [Anaerolineales bacterium]|nr:class I SAM-dependent methyltransferase [Anaerolineales bacterium]